MQISTTIMRLVVILSVLVQIYADTVGGPLPSTVGSSQWTRSPLGASARIPGRPLVPLQPVAATATTERAAEPARHSSGQQAQDRGGFRTERNVYRTKLSKLRLILLADMLNEIPPPQQELITCLANSSTLNVTTKHCDCEAYSCKDLLASSSPSPFNLIQPKRKIHTSCREHCCRKKKFNRSIDPAALENVVVSSLTSSPSSSLSSSSSASAANAASRQRFNSVTVTSSAHRSPSVQPNRVQSVESAHHRTTDPPSPGTVRDRTSCSNGDINQISISNNRTIIPWLYRVGLIETKHPLCVGALIHPSLILTTAVCVINKKPEELLVWNGAGNDGAESQDVGRPVRRIILPEQFATTFQRLENNVALLLLLEGLGSYPKDKQPPTAPGRHGSTNVPIPIGTGALRSWTVSVRGDTTGGGEPEWRRRNSAKMELFRARRKWTPVPASICLSSIIDQAMPDPAASFSSTVCRIVSLHRRKLPDEGGRTGDAPPPAMLPAPGTNYVTTNISIFPATECRPEHQEYLQHDGNLCAGYGLVRNRSIDVEYSGSPLICDVPQPDGRVFRTVRGLLTWSTDINHAPHLFTNLTTYRPWIEREIERLEATAEPQRATSPSEPIILRSVPYAPPRVPSVLYG
ncbi:uncharacterized protein LOC131285669 [Anopheles ziemanni]|uniref:uncharacterized protein LOC131268137 n=1 Tax=Anopheles coustani TaxID=139045 RepID=UPI002659A163|nr:uncharacterized protein LOC131268137 [Anopheles coustani]XP_058170510.1 uncharacterized protein LOC131285669 [Anopheles ziemanni]